MKILYLTFYFEPDLGPCSLRNTSLSKMLSKYLNNTDHIDVLTTFPHRYCSYEKNDIPYYENNDNLHIYRINVSSHRNGYFGQIVAFLRYFLCVIKKTKKNDYDLIFASSSKLLTAYLGYYIAHKINKPLYIDIRDIFYENIQNIINNKIIKYVVLQLIKKIENVVFNYARHINLISEGFVSYFEIYKCKSFSFFSHGIDDDFLQLRRSERSTKNDKYKIIYAGNIGEGQGLENIIPSAAELLQDNYSFAVFGDGGTKAKLQREIKKRNLLNVEINDPIDRKKLKEVYCDADFLFIHLNNYWAFKKVLPSKIFELAAYDKPIIAGVTGFSYHFIEKYIPNVILFESCDLKDMIKKLKSYSYKNEYRTQFVKHFQRDIINVQMAHSIISVALPEGS